MRGRRFEGGLMRGPGGGGGYPGVLPQEFTQPNVFQAYNRLARGQYGGGPFGGRPMGRGYRPPGPPPGAQGGPYTGGPYTGGPATGGPYSPGGPSVGGPATNRAPGGQGGYRPPMQRGGPQGGAQEPANGGRPPPPGSYGNSATERTLDLISRYESPGGNQRNFRFDPTHTAQGYFQITNQTWHGIARQSGIDLRQYPSAMSAPYAVQRQAARWLLTHGGVQNWSHFNPRLHGALRAAGLPTEGRYPDSGVNYGDGQQGGPQGGGPQGGDDQGTGVPSSPGGYPTSPDTGPQAGQPGHFGTNRPVPGTTTPDTGYPQTGGGPAPIPPGGSGTPPYPGFAGDSPPGARYRGPNVAGGGPAPNATNAPALPAYGGTPPAGPAPNAQTGYDTPPAGQGPPGYALPAPTGAQPNAQTGYDTPPAPVVPGGTNDPSGSGFGGMGQGYAPGSTVAGNTLANPAGGAPGDNGLAGVILPPGSYMPDNLLPPTYTPGAGGGQTAGDTQFSNPDPSQAPNWYTPGGQPAPPPAPPDATPTSSTNGTAPTTALSPPQPVAGHGNRPGGSNLAGRPPHNVMAGPGAGEEDDNNAQLLPDDGDDQGQPPGEEEPQPEQAVDGQGQPVDDEGQPAEEQQASAEQPAATPGADELNDPSSLNYSPGVVDQSDQGDDQGDQTGGQGQDPELAAISGGTAAQPIPMNDEGVPLQFPAKDQRRYDSIAKVEKTLLPNNNGIAWGRVSNGGGDQDLQNMTVSQVAALDTPGGDNTDFGGMQINRHDLVAAAKGAGYDPDHQKFNQQTQEDMADYLYALYHTKYWRGFDDDPNSASVAQGLISGATHAAQVSSAQLDKDRVALSRALAEKNRQIAKLAANGEFNTDRWRNARWDAYQAEKRLADIHEEIRRNPPTRSTDDLAGGIGAMVQAVTLLGGNMATVPAGLAAGMLAAAIKARTARNDYDYKEAWGHYKDSMNAAVQGAALESKLFSESIAGQNADVNATINKLRPIAMITDNLNMLAKLDSGRLKEAVAQVENYAKLAKQMALTHAQLVPMMEGRQLGADLTRDWIDKNREQYDANGHDLPAQVKLDIDRQVAQAVSAATTGKEPGAAKGATPGTAAGMYNDWLQNFITTKGRQPTQAEKDAAYNQYRSRGSALVDTPAIPDTWDGMKDGKPPPGYEQYMPQWRAALQYALTGKPPPSLRSLGPQWNQVFEQLMDAAGRAQGISAMDQAKIQTDFKSRQEARIALEKSATSGQTKKNIVSMNTLAHHSDLFRQYAEALDGGSPQTMQRIINQFQGEFGGVQILKSWLAGVTLGDEYVRVLSPTSGGTVTDRDEMKKILDSSYSKEQLLGLADALDAFVAGRVDAEVVNYSALGWNPKDQEARREDFTSRFLSDRAREVYTEQMQQYHQQQAPSEEKKFKANRPANVPPDATLQHDNAGHYRWIQKSTGNTFDPSTGAQQ